MERYNFVNKEDAFKEERSEFTNTICKLLYNQNSCDADKAISNGKIIFHGLDAHVYDICELVDNYIPLMAYYELKTYGKRHFEGNHSEYEEAIIRTKKACDNYYVDDRNTALEIINYIEEAEISIPIELFFNEDGSHITKKKYGEILITTLVKDLKEKFL